MVDQAMGQNYLSVDGNPFEKVYDAIFWTMTAGRIEDENINWFDNACSLSGFITLNKPDQARFLSCEEVTQHRILTWLEATIDRHAEKTKAAFMAVHPDVPFQPRPDQRDVAGIKCRLDELLELKLSPPTFSTIFEIEIPNRG